MYSMVSFVFFFFYVLGVFFSWNYLFLDPRVFIVQRLDSWELMRSINYVVGNIFFLLKNALRSSPFYY